MENFPKLEGIQVAVIRAEVATGHMYDIDFNLVISDQQEIYSIFDSKEDAIDYIKNFIESNRKFEFTIFDKGGDLIKMITPD